MKIAKMFGSVMLAAAVALTGCGPAAPSKTGDKKPDAKKDVAKGKESEHAHGKGPNGGVLFDLGKYHGEFTVDHDKKECTVLVIGNDEKTPKMVDCKELTVTTKASKTKDGKAVPPMAIKMVPKDLKDGLATKYVGTDPGLGNVADFEGTVLGEIDGKPSSGEFKE